MTGFQGNKVIKRIARTGEIVAIYPSVRVAAAVEGANETTVRKWCNGRPKLGDSRHTYEYQKTERQKQEEALQQDGRCNASRCWSCARYYANCPWTIDFTPVPGWNAIETVKMVTHQSQSGKSVKQDTFYKVIDCPLFVPDPPRKAAKPVPDSVRKAVADAYEKRVAPPQTVRLQQPVKPPKNTYDVDLCQKCELLKECQKDRLICKKRVRWPNV